MDKFRGLMEVAGYLTGEHIKGNPSYPSNINKE